MPRSGSFLLSIKSMSQKHKSGECIGWYTVPSFIDWINQLQLALYTAEHCPVTYWRINKTVLKRMHRSGSFILSIKSKSQQLKYGSVLDSTKLPSLIHWKNQPQLALYTTEHCATLRLFCKAKQIPRKPVENLDGAIVLYDV